MRKKPTIYHGFELTTGSTCFEKVTFIEKNLLYCTLLTQNMVVLVQLNNLSTEPKTLEALRKAISRRKDLIEEHILSDTEDENQETLVKATENIDTPQNENFHPSLNLGESVDSPTSILPSIQTHPTGASNDTTLAEYLTSNKIDTLDSPNGIEKPIVGRNLENSSYSTQQSRTPPDSGQSQSDPKAVDMEKLQLEENTIMKKIEKLSEEKHKLFLTFKRMISEQNGDCGEGAIQEIKQEYVNFKYRIPFYLATKLMNFLNFNLLFLTQHYYFSKVEDIDNKAHNSTDNDDINRKSQDTTPSQDASFSVPNQAYKRRRNPVDIPSNHSSTNSSYRKSSRAGATTRGAFHFPGRGRSYISQYPNRGRSGYYNEHDFRM
ncbi:hypothetical protein K7432_016335, partial [Basidiobolus ranarum]